MSASARVVENQSKFIFSNLLMERLNLTIIITPEGFKDICYRVDLVSFCSNVLEMSSARLLSHLS